jgi:hypothetical protein
MAGADAGGDAPELERPKKGGGKGRAAGAKRPGGKRTAQMRGAASATSADEGSLRERAELRLTLTRSAAQEDPRLALEEARVLALLDLADAIRSSREAAAPAPPAARGGTSARSRSARSARPSASGPGKS